MKPTQEKEAAMSVEQGVEVRKVGIPAARADGRHSTAGVLGVAGIVGPILFTAAFIAQGLFRPGYSHVAEPVSALAAGPNGWIQNANFFVFGPLMIAYAIGLHLGVRSTRRGVVGPALLVLSGLGLILSGLFPWVRDATGELSVPPGHLVGALMAFLFGGLGLIVISRRMARDPRWRSVATYALASGIAIIVLFLATGRLAVPDDAPLHQWAGLMQRATVAVWFPCTIVLAFRLRRIENIVQDEGARILGERRPLI
jgi:hypothetical membrane protein